MHRATEPITEWATTFLYWTALTVLMFFWSLPTKPFADEQASVTVGVDVPPAASMGSWAVVHSDLAAYWVLDVNASQHRGHKIVTEYSEATGVSRGNGDSSIGTSREVLLGNQPSAAIAPTEVLTTLSRLEERLASASTDVLVVMFFSPMCGHCRAAMPKFEQLQHSFLDPHRRSPASAIAVEFAKVDVTRCRECGAAYHVKAVPAFIVFLRNRVLGSVRSGFNAQLLREDIGIAVMKASRMHAQEKKSVLHRSNSSEHNVVKELPSTRDAAGDDGTSAVPRTWRSRAARSGAATPRVNAASSGYAYVFAKTYREPRGDELATRHSDVPDTTIDNPRPFAVDGNIWWREGVQSTSDLHSMRFVGGAVSTTPSERGDRTSFFLILGIPQSMLGQTDLATLAPSNSSIEEVDWLKMVSTRIAKRQTVNATLAAKTFALLVRQNERHSASFTNISAESMTAQSVSPPPLSDGRCVWIGSLRLGQSGGLGKSLDRIVDDAAAVEGDLYSTCGDHVRLLTTTSTYEALKRAWNPLVFVFGVVPMTLYLVGLTKQIQWIRNSRARTIRMSRVQLLWITLWLSFFVFYGEVGWRATPNNKKMLNVFYSVAIFATFGTLHVFSMVDNEQRQAAGQPHNRTLMFFLILAGMSLGGLVPALLKSYMFHAETVLFFCCTYWLPQLIQSLLLGGRDSVVPWYAFVATLVPVNFALVLLAAPLVGNGAALAPHPQPGLLILAILIVCCEAVILVTLPKLVLRRVLPKWMMPWRHEYELPHHRVMAASGGLSEDPDCSICSESLLNPARDSAVVINHGGAVPVWQTPCKHLFHEPCLQQWMDQRMECPLCRKALPEP